MQYDTRIDPEEFRRIVTDILNRVNVPKETIASVILLAYDFGFDEGQRLGNTPLEDRKAYRRGYASGYYYRQYIEEDVTVNGHYHAVAQWVKLMAKI